MVIADSNNFKVQRYYGSGKSLRDHKAWENEMAEYEVGLLYVLFAGICQMITCFEYFQYLA